MTLSNAESVPTCTPFARRAFNAACGRLAGSISASNDYVGLANHPFVKERMIDGIAREGCGSNGNGLGCSEGNATASRRSSGRLPT